MICDDLRLAFIAADAGDGKVAAMANRVTGMRQRDVPQLTCGVPDFADSKYRLMILPQRPPAPTTDMMTSVPEQRVPGSARPTFWYGSEIGTGVLKKWSARLLVDFTNKQAMHAIAHATGRGDSAPKAPDALVIGVGGFGSARYDDGNGTWSFAEVIWEIMPDGTPRVFQIEIIPGTDWQAPLMKFMGFTTDRQLLGWLFEGTRYLADVPPGLRLFPNLKGLAPHGLKIADSIGQLADAGMYDCVPIMPITDPTPLTILSRCPLPLIGGGTVGVNARAKKGTDEMRRVDDASVPHDELLTRETEEGAAAGVPVISFNRLTGAKKEFFDHTRWPKEVKWMPSHAARASAFMKYASHVSGIPVVAMVNDYRWFFYCFQTSRKDYPYTMMQVIVNLGGVYYFCSVKAKVLLMGFAPASNIAQRFAHEYDEGLMRAFRPTHDAIMCKMPTALQKLAKERSAALGPQHAVFVWLATYTDDQKAVALLPFLAPFEALIEQKAAENGVKLCKMEKRQAGTVVDWIGPTFAFTPGFLYIGADKIAKALIDCGRAIDGTITADEYESNNGLLAYAMNTLAAPVGTLQGIALPLKIARGPAMIIMTKDAVAAYNRATRILTLVACASFPCHVPELDESPALTALRELPRAFTDACTGEDSGTGMGMWLMGDGCAIDLHGAWCLMPITWIEGLGQALAFPQYHHVLRAFSRFVLSGDAVSSQTMLQGAASAPALRDIYDCLAATDSGKDLLHKGLFDHCAGGRNMLADLLSRPVERHKLPAVTAALGTPLRQRKPAGPTRSLIAKVFKKVVPRLFTAKPDADVDIVTYLFSGPEAGEHGVDTTCAMDGVLVHMYDMVNGAAMNFDATDGFETAQRMCAAAKVIIVSAKCSPFAVSRFYPNGPQPVFTRSDVSGAQWRSGHEAAEVGWVNDHYGRLLTLLRCAHAAKKPFVIESVPDYGATLVNGKPNPLFSAPLREHCPLWVWPPMAEFIKATGAVVVTFSQCMYQVVAGAAYRPLREYTSAPTSLLASTEIAPFLLHLDGNFCTHARDSHRTLAGKTTDGGFNTETKAAWAPGLNKAIADATLNVLTHRRNSAAAHAFQMHQGCADGAPESQSPCTSD